MFLPRKPQGTDFYTQTYQKKKIIFRIRLLIILETSIRGLIVLLHCGLNGISNDSLDNLFEQLIAQETYLYS